MSKNLEGDSPTPFPLIIPWPQKPYELRGGTGGGDFPWPWSQVAQHFGGDTGGSHPWPWNQLFASMAADLIGRKLQVSKKNSNFKVDPGTVHVVIDDEGRIEQFWIDADLPAA